MKKSLLITLISLFLFSVSYAQTGVYMTYDDFKNGKLVKADPKSFFVKMVKHKVMMKVNGEAKEYQYSDIFGLLIDGKLYRYGKSAMIPLPCQLIMVTDNYALWRYTEITKYFDGTADKTTDVNYISNKLDGEMVYYGFGTKVDKLAEHKGFEPLVNCIRSGKKKLLMLAIGDCMAKDPTWKKTPEDAIPPVK